MEPSSGSTSSQHVPANRYELLRKKYKEEEIKYDNYNKVHIKLTFRMCVIGGTGSGKTNAVIDLIEEIDAFNKILLFAKVLDEPIYANFIEDMREAEKDTHKQILTVGDNLENLPKVESNSKKDSTLLIVDDMLDEKAKTLSHASAYWTRGRKYGCSSMYLSQDYFGIPTVIRKQSDYFLFTKINTVRDLHMILKDHQLGVTDDQIEQLYLTATKDGFPNYFLVDKVARAGDPYRFRKNLTPLPIPSKSSVGDMTKRGPAATKAPSTASGKRKANAFAPAKENAPTGRRVHLAPPPPLPGATPAQVNKYIESWTTKLQDGDVTMEQVYEAMEDVPDNVREAMMEEVPWWESDTFTEGSGMVARRPKKRRVPKHVPAALSSEMIRALERMSGSRKQSYWK
jgi:hypothetical protein